MANIFSQAKDLYKMQAEARDMQKKMKQVVVSGTSKNDDIEVRMDGTNKVVAVNIDEEILKPENKKRIEKAFKQAVKDASDKLQKELMKDMDMDKLKSMLG